MKQLILILLTLTITINLFADTMFKTTVPKDAQMCKVYKDKVKSYQLTMRSDEYARKTLKHYKEVKTQYCKLTDK